MTNITNTLNLCKRWYDEKTFLHAVRVADYTINSPLTLGLTAIGYHKDTIYVLALCHDLIEDTGVSWDEISKATGISKEIVADVLTLLSKPRGTNYVEYITNIRESGSSIAYCIKLADMKDHLMEKETLTERLKEKYWNALPHLL